MLQLWLKSQSLVESLAWELPYSADGAKKKKYKETSEINFNGSMFMVVSFQGILNICLYYE